NSDMSKAVRYALDRDVVFVAAAGNRPEVTRVGFPAVVPGVLAAAGVDRNGNHADVSVTGPEVVLAAPAVDITSTGNFGAYGTGTPAPTATLAGAAALARARSPTLTAPEVTPRPTATATDKGPPGRDDQYGYGIVNLVAALTADVPPLTPTATPTHKPPAPSG